MIKNNDSARESIILKANSDKNSDKNLDIVFLSKNKLSQVNRSFGIRDMHWVPPSLKRGQTAKENRLLQLSSTSIKAAPKQEVVSITYEEIGLFPRSFSRVLDRFLKQVFSDVENLVIQEYRFYRYLFLTTLKCLLIFFFVPFLINFLAKSYIVRPLTEYFWNTKQTEIFLNSYQQKHAFAELKDFEEKLYFESLIYPKSMYGEQKVATVSSFNFPSTKTNTASELIDKYNTSNTLSYETDNRLASFASQKRDTALFSETQAMQKESQKARILNTNSTHVGSLKRNSSTNFEQLGFNNSDDPALNANKKNSSFSSISDGHNYFLGKITTFHDKLLQINKNPILVPSSMHFLVKKNENSYTNKLHIRNSYKKLYNSPNIYSDRFFKEKPIYLVSTQIKNNKNYTSADYRNLTETNLENLNIERTQSTKSLKDFRAPKTSLLVYQTIEADRNIQQRYQAKIIELAQRYNDQSVEAVTNFFGDIVSLATLFYLLYILEIQINITQSFLLEVFFGLDDSKKSLLILLVTDLLVGYHSSNLWELFFEVVFNHYGLPESQTGIFLLVATLPVLLDVLFKYLIFRHLNRSSPATVATYHAIIE